MKKLLFLFLLVASIAACGQLNKTVVKANAYYTIPIPGTIMVDESGKQVPPPRTKVYTVYLEIKGTLPQWTKAWVDGKCFTLFQHSITHDSINIGKRYADDKKIVMKASKGNALVQLDLSPDDTEKKPPQKLGINELLLQGKLKGKPFFYKTSNLVELTSPEYQ